MAREWWGPWRGLSSVPDSTPPQVVAVVMDMFTDVDLLSEVLEAAARRVPVYILLDEVNAQHFLDMADKCHINLHHVDVSDRRVEGMAGREGVRSLFRDIPPLLPQFLRVRTVAGPTYYCRTGKSFKGHVKEKFLLVDCAVVMSGSYRCAQPRCPPPHPRQPQHLPIKGPPLQKPSSWSP